MEYDNARIASMSMEVLGIVIVAMVSVVVYHVYSESVRKQRIEDALKSGFAGFVVGGITFLVLDHVFSSVKKPKPRTTTTTTPPAAEDTIDRKFEMLMEQMQEAVLLAKLARARIGRHA